ncbi:MAG: hypothetical protein P8Y71_22065 [Pseudolabrys sp.]
MSESMSLINIGIGSVCLFIIAYFTGVKFPTEIAEEGEGHLPKKFLAVVIFVGINILVFLFFLAFLHLWQNQKELAPVFKAAGFSNLADLLGKQGTGRGISPLRPEMIVQSTIAFFALFGIRRWRRIEAGALRELHNISLIAQDASSLSLKIQTDSLSPISHRGGNVPFNGEDEARKAVDRLQRRVSQTDAISPDSSLAVKSIKLKLLIKIWAEHKEWSDTLREAELPRLKSIQLANQRRNTLAIRLDELVVNIEQGKIDPSVLADIGELINRDDVDPDGILKKLREMGLGTEVSGGERSVTILLAPIIRYFAEEYDDSLKQMADAIGISVMMSGDEAVERLAVLKSYGFTGLGQVKVIDLNTAIFIAFSVFCSMILIFNLYVYFFRSNVPTNFALLIAFSASITLAVVAGAMVGGLRALARADSTPWGWYLLTALVMALLHLVLILAVVSIDITAVTEAHRARQNTFARLLIGSIIPFSLVLGICLMSRGQVLRIMPLPVWVRDAVVLAAVMAAVMVVIIMLAETTHIKSDTSIMSRLLTLPPLFALVGGVVGAVVVNRVRQAALSRITEG